METKNQPIKDFLTWYLPAIIVILLWIMFSTKSNLMNFLWNNDEIITDTWANISSWVENIVVEQTSWTNASWSIITWEIISTWEIVPADARWYIDYILKKWTVWKNFFIINPVPQPVIHWSTPAENNKVLFEYVYRYRSKITLNKNAWWYILITLNKPLQNNREVFLAINWYSKWALSKKLSKAVYDETEFLYNIKGIPAGWYNISLLDYLDHWYLDLWWFVSESWNWIKQITIVLK